jgi:hypothetical protein
LIAYSGVRSRPRMKRMNTHLNPPLALRLD